MPKSLQQLTIFVSGPAGTESEKAALRTVADEISRRLEKTHGVTLRVMGWPHDMRPGIDVDTQAEVNRQIGDQFDVYVGLLGTRFGTSTPRAGSGTEEEFEHAVRRFQRDSTSVRVLFYFKRDVADPFAVDVEQLQRVLQFRQQLKSRGVLYQDFNDTGEFATLVRQHLDALIIDEWAGSAWAARTRESDADAGSDQATELSSSEELHVGRDSIGALARAVEFTEEEEDDERGVLEYMAGFYEASEALTKIINGITRETERVGQEIQARTGETDLISRELQDEKAVGGSRAHQQLIGRAREAVDHAAGDLDGFVASVSVYVEQYKTQSRAFFDNLRNAYEARSEIGQQETSDERAGLAAMIDAIEESREHTIAFQSAVNAVPALTGRFKRARRRTAATLGELIAEMSFSVQEARSVLGEAGDE